MAKAFRAWVLLLGGLAMTAGSAWFFTDHALLVRDGERAAGVVTALSENKVRGSRLYRPVVRYQTAGGVERQFTERAGLWRGLFPVGGEVVVIHRPKAPEKARILSFWTLWFMPLLMFMFGAACLAAGGYELYR